MNTKQALLSIIKTNITILLIIENIIEKTKPRKKCTKLNRKRTKMSKKRTMLVTISLTENREER